MDNILNQCAELRKLHLVVKSLTMLSNDLPYNLKKLEELHIEVDDGLKWVDKLWKEGLRGLTSLKVLTMGGLILDGDEVIYAIGAMRQLRELRIIRCDVDKLVFPAAPDNFLPQLEVLEIRWCDRLEKVHFRKRALQSLCILRIDYCNAHVIGLQHLLQLRELKIAGLQEIKERLITTDVDEHCLPSDVQTYHVCFPNLQCLRLHYLWWMKRICDDSVSFPSLSEITLEHCPHLEKLPIYAIGAMRQLRELHIIACGIDKLVIPAAPDNFLPQIEALEIRWCNRLEKVHFRKRALQSLCFLRIHGCDSIAHVVGLQHLLQLRELEISYCEKFEERLITTDVDEHCSPSDVQTYPVCFPNLQRLRLRSLSLMKRICDDSISFPSLSMFNLFNCPKLEKLPRGLMNENRTLISGQIVGKKEWWEGLKWEDDAFKSYLRPLFVDTRHNPPLQSFSRPVRIRG